METSTTNFKGSFNKRLELLTSKWEGLMNQQNEMDHKDIVSEEFQSKRKRIGRLYAMAVNMANLERINAKRKNVRSVPSNVDNIGASQWYGNGHYNGD